MEYGFERCLLAIVTAKNGIRIECLQEMSGDDDDCGDTAEGVKIKTLRFLPIRIRGFFTRAFSPYR